MALEVFRFIHISFGFCASSMYPRRISSSGLGYCVQFRYSSSSGSSTIVGLIVWWTGIFDLMSGRGVLWYHFILRGLRGILQVNFPVFQSMSGFCSFSQGNPRMIFCFPKPVTIRLVVISFPLIVRVRFTNEVIIPVLFFVPSTLQATRGSFKVRILNPFFLAKF